MTTTEQANTVRDMRTNEQATNKPWEKDNKRDRRANKK